MFGFLDMMFDFDERRVEQTDVGEFFVSTMKVNDVVGFNYETAIQHNEFNCGDLMIVDHYVTFEEAKEGHNRWIKFCEGNPTVIQDNEKADIAIIAGKEREFYEKGVNE